MCELGFDWERYSRDFEWMCLDVGKTPLKDNNFGHCKSAHIDRFNKSNCSKVLWYKHISFNMVVTLTVNMGKEEEICRYHIIMAKEEQICRYHIMRTIRICFVALCKLRFN